jgi:hypothetical protein
MLALGVKPQVEGDRVPVPLRTQRLLPRVLQELLQRSLDSPDVMDEERRDEPLHLAHRKFRRLLRGMPGPGQDRPGKIVVGFRIPVAYEFRWHCPGDLKACRALFHNDTLGLVAVQRV